MPPPSTTPSCSSILCVISFSLPSLFFSWLRGRQDPVPVIGAGADVEHDSFPQLHPPRHLLLPSPWRRRRHLHSPPTPPVTRCQACRIWWLRLPLPSSSTSLHRVLSSPPLLDLHRRRMPPLPRSPELGTSIGVGVGRRRSPRVAAPVPQAHKLPSTRPPTSHHRQAPSTPLSMSPRTAGDLSLTTVRAGAGEEMEAPMEMYHRMLRRKS